MKITDVLKRVDELYPNHYTREQKLNWCFELTAEICEEVRAVYRKIQLPKNVDGEYFLPNYILFEDIAILIVDGVEQTKVDERSFNIPKNVNVEIVYKIRMLPYKDFSIDGSFSFGVNFITIPNNPFEIGNYLQVNDVFVDVLDVIGDKIITQPKFTVGTKTAKISLILLDETIPPPPYDVMYVDFVLGKIGYYQNDLEEYNKHMSSFNVKMDSYKNWYKSTNPINKNLKFKNIW